VNTLQFWLKTITKSRTVAYCATVKTKTNKQTKSGDWRGAAIIIVTPNFEILILRAHKLELTDKRRQEEGIFSICERGVSDISESW
jgi:hypothetical protein